MKNRGQAEACLCGAIRGQALDYTALMLMLMGKNWGFAGKTISMFLPENMDCFSGDLVFPVVLFVIQFSSVFPDYLLIILIFHSYFPVVICDLTKLQREYNKNFILKDFPLFKSNLIKNIVFIY